MNKDFISQLTSFVSSPVGIVAIAIGLLMVFQASRSRQVGWLLFSLLCFASSLSTFGSQWMKVPPALVFPLQQLRSVDRPLSIVLLVLLTIVALSVPMSWRQKTLPKPIDYLIAVQGVIIFKTYVYGSSEFAILSLLTFGAIIYTMKKALGNWLTNDENFYFAARSIAITGTIFIVLNTYQFILNRSAVTFITNRFSGTTANPQQAGILLAAVIPCLLFVIQQYGSWKFPKYCWTAILVALIYFLALTGSRTGILMGGVSILLFYRNNGSAWFRIILFFGIAAAVVIPFLQPENLSSSATGIDTSVSDRFTSTNNTREGVWSGMWNSFLDNMILGAPLEAGGRMGYGENSWLAVASNLGLFGLIPMLLMGWECINLLWQLYKLGERQSYYFFQCSTVISGLGSMLVGSFFEAFLLGNITNSMLIFLAYLLMGGYLIEVDRFRTHYAREEGKFADSSGVY